MAKNSTDWRDTLAALTGIADPDNCHPTPNTTSDECANSANRSATLFYEKKGRAGKSATILADIGGCTEDTIHALASELRHKLGTGGSCRGGEILLQGDRRADVRRLLIEKGFKVKG